MPTRVQVAPATPPPLPTLVAQLLAPLAQNWLDEDVCLTPEEIAALPLSAAELTLAPDPAFMELLEHDGDGALENLIHAAITEEATARAERHETAETFWPAVITRCERLSTEPRPGFYPLDSFDDPECVWRTRTSQATQGLIDRMDHLRDLLLEAVRRRFAHFDPAPLSAHFTRILSAAVFGKAVAQAAKKLLEREADNDQALLLYPIGDDEQAAELTLAKDGPERFGRVRPDANLVNLLCTLGIGRIQLLQARREAVEKNDERLIEWLDELARWPAIEEVYARTLLPLCADAGHPSLEALLRQAEAHPRRDKERLRLVYGCRATEREKRLAWAALHHFALSLSAARLALETFESGYLAEVDLGGPLRLLPAAYNDPRSKALSPSWAAHGSRQQLAAAGKAEAAGPPLSREQMSAILAGRAPHTTLPLYLQTPCRGNDLRRAVESIADRLNETQMSAMARELRKQALAATEVTHLMELVATYAIVHLEAEEKTA